MAQSLASILLHLVYSTKDRHPWITPDVAPELYAYQARIFQEIGCPALIINGVSDHVHALFSFGRTQRICDVVEEVKKQSSKWLKTQSPSLSEFAWQGGYAIFSLGESARQRAFIYIRNQESHHTRSSFQDEMRTLFKKYRVDFDERYVWE